MELKLLDEEMTVCQIESVSRLDLHKDFFFIGKTDEEISLVCRTKDVPKDTVAHDDGWRGFRIQGVLDFSLVGILSKISNILATHDIAIFVVSTYNTDYILVKEKNLKKAIQVLDAEGYKFINA